VSFPTVKIVDFCFVTDFVANGSFESLRNNVKYLDEDGFAILVRITDYSKKWKGSFKYVSEAAYKFLRHSYLIENDLIMSNVGEPGKVFLLPNLGQPMTLGPNSILIRPDKLKAIEKYLYYYFLSNLGKEKIDSITSGTTQKKFNKTSFRNLKIPLPSLANQQKIVDKLDVIFSGIDTASAAAQANAKNAEALFVSYLNKVCNEDFIKSKKYKLGEVCSFQGGSQPAKSFFQYECNDENIRFIQIRDYKSDKNLVYIPKKMAKRFCNETDVMIGRYGPPVFQILRGIAGSFNVALMKATPQEKLLTKDYLYYFLKNPLIQDYIIALSNRAAGQSGMNKETIEPYEISLPSLEEQITSVIKIELCLEHSQKIIKLNELKIKNLSFLKQSILQKALSGELVKD
jgi:type I restriction enzyme S subunit